MALLALMALATLLLAGYLLCVVRPRVLGLLLVYEVERGNARAVLSLVNRGADVNESDDGFAPIMAAVEHGETSIARVLLEHGARVDARDASGGTPLMTAASLGDGAMIKVLVNSGADVNAQDKLGRTAAHWALAGGHRAVLPLLISRGVRSREPAIHRSEHPGKWHRALHAPTRESPRI